MRTKIKRGKILIIHLGSQHICKRENLQKWQCNHINLETEILKELAERVECSCLQGGVKLKKTFAGFLRICY